MANDAATSLGIDIGGTSVKAAILTADGAVLSARSGPYTQPDSRTIIEAVREAVEGIPDADRDAATVVGVCLPGVRDERTGAITASVNVPGLVGLHPRDVLTRASVADGARSVSIFTDAFAACADVVLTRGLTGRTLGLSLGTGIGASVIDRVSADDVISPIRVSGDGPGHLGQIDCTVAERDGSPAPIGPDGGRGGLEAYLGLPALRRRLGPEAETGLRGLDVRQPPLAALVRAIRIAHALYRPDHVVLLGGVGIRLRPHVEAVHAAVSDALTSLARPGWTLSVGESEHHAAIGAARLAACPGSLTKIDQK